MKYCSGYCFGNFLWFSNDGGRDRKSTRTRCVCLCVCVRI